MGGGGGPIPWGGGGGGNTGHGTIYIDSDWGNSVWLVGGFFFFNLRHAR